MTQMANVEMRMIQSHDYRESGQAMHSDVASPKNFWAFCLSASNTFISLGCHILAGEAT